MKRKVNHGLAGSSDLTVGLGAYTALPNPPHTLDVTWKKRRICLFILPYSAYVHSVKPTGYSFHRSRVQCDGPTRPTANSVCERVRVCGCEQLPGSCSRRSAACRFVTCSEELAASRTEEQSRKRRSVIRFFIS